MICSVYMYIATLANVVILFSDTRNNILTVTLEKNYQECDISTIKIEVVLPLDMNVNFICWLYYRQPI